MKNLVLSISLFMSLLLLTISAKAQEKNFGQANIGIVSGVVTDAENSTPMAGANVTLHKSTDSSMVTGDVTNTQGQFKIDNVPAGSYFIRINFVGYESRILDKVNISNANRIVVLGTVQIKPVAISSGGVEVTANKDAAVYGVDKKVFNVEKNIAASGGTALDVMQTIPAVAVDIDGNVSLRGLTSVRILIDGKPSNLSSSTILDQIPASTIERVEVITNPSAKYEAEGTGGIINIILKKKSQEGMNALLSFNAGTEDKYNASINTNWRLGFINIFANYDNRFYRMSGTGLSVRDNNDTSLSTRATDRFTRRGNNHNFKAGFDLMLGKSNSLSFSGLYNFGEHNSTEYSRLDYLNPVDELLSYGISDNLETDDHEGSEFTLGYRHNFGAKQHDLTVDLFYSTRGGDEISNLNENYFAGIESPIFDPIYHRNTIGEPRKTFTVQSDYLLPIDDDTRFEAGYKSSFRNLDQNYRYELFDFQQNLWDVVDTLSNHFIYDEAVHAGYLNYSGAFGSFKYQAGLRAEATYINTSQELTNEKNEDSYINFFPSVFLKQEFSETQSLHLNYTRRIRRPGTWELNPFREYYSRTNYRQGNPNLKPEFINSYETGHYIMFDKTSFMTTLFYRQTEDMIARMTYTLDSLTAYQTNENIASSDSYGLEFTATQEFMKGWRADASFSYFRTIIKSEENTGMSNVDRDNYSWTAKFNNYINLFGLADMQLMLNYRAPMVTPQGRMSEMFYADFGLKADIIENVLSVNFRLSDIFNTMKFNVNSTTNNGTDILFERKRNSRVAFLGFTYKFNDYRRSPSERRKRGDDSNGGDMMDDE